MEYEMEEQLENSHEYCLDHNEKEPCEKYMKRDLDKIHSDEEIDIQTYEREFTKLKNKMEAIMYLKHSPSSSIVGKDFEGITIDGNFIIYSSSDGNFIIYSSSTYSNGDIDHYELSISKEDVNKPIEYFAKVFLHDYEENVRKCLERQKREKLLRLEKCEREERELFAKLKEKYEKS